MSEPIFTKLGMHIMAPETIYMKYFVYEYVVRERPGKNVTTPTNAHTPTDILF
jgi:hypothetical protein